MVQWTRNFIDALEDNREVADFALVGGVLAESLGHHALLSRCTFHTDLADRLTALAYKMSKNSSPTLGQSAHAASPNSPPSQSDASPNPPPSTPGSFDEVRTRWCSLL